MITQDFVNFRRMCECVRAYGAPVTLVRNVDHTLLVAVS